MKDIFKFTRFYLSLFVSISGLVVYFIASTNPDFEIFIPWLGLFTLALGSSALNQIQEKKFDKKMKRTKTRPYANGVFSFQKALFISVFLLFSSFSLLYFSINIYGIYFFLTTIVIYNLLYTYLKPITYWALILGSFLGVIAPTLGWLVANNMMTSSLFELKFMYIFILFFLWQVPHFWLLVLINKNDYKKAGFPTLQDKIGKSGLVRTISIWNILIALNGLAVVVTSIVSPIIASITIISSIYIIYSSLVLFITRKYKKIFFKMKFMEINTYILLIMILLVFDNMSNISI